MDKQIYRSRFYDSMPEPITMIELGDGIRRVDANFNFCGQNIIYADQPYGEFEIAHRGTVQFDCYADQLRSNAEWFFTRYGYKHPLAMRALDNATEIIVLHAIWPPSLPEQRRMFEVFDPVWEWLLFERNGVLNVDGGGFSNSEGTIL